MDDLKEQCMIIKFKVITDNELPKTHMLIILIKLNFISNLNFKNF